MKIESEVPNNQVVVETSSEERAITKLDECGSQFMIAPGLMIFSN
jgi:hypothetical protein